MGIGRKIGSDRDIINFLLLFLSAVISVYFLPAALNKIIFIGYLYAFFRSKKNPIWLAFFFVLIAHPGGMFNSGQGAHKVPVFGLMAGITFSYFDFVFIVALLKAIVKGKKNTLLLKEQYKVIIFLVAIHLMYTLTLGVDIDTFIKDIRKILGFSMIFTIPKLITNSKQIAIFSKIIFMTSFLVVGGQIYFLMTGQFIDDFLGGSGAERQILEESFGVTDFIRPMAKGVMLVFFSFVFALFYLAKKKPPLNKSYLIVVVTTAVLSMIISATRTWVSVFAFILILYMIYVTKVNFKAILIFLGAFGVVTITYFLIPELRYMIENSFRRLSTMGALAQGDLTAGGTLGRITERLPALMVGVNKNPIFGWGFSEIYHQYKDPHVANFDMILQFGIIGQFVFLYFYIGYISLVVFNFKRLSYSNDYKNPIQSLLVQFLGILLFQFTTFSFFGISGVRPFTIYFITTFLSFSEIFINEALIVERKIQLQKLTVK